MLYSRRGMSVPPLHEFSVQLSLFVGLEKQLRALVLVLVLQRRSIIGYRLSRYLTPLYFRMLAHFLECVFRDCKSNVSHALTLNKVNKLNFKKRSLPVSSAGNVFVP